MWDEVLKAIDHTVTPQKAVKLWDGNVDSVKLVSQGINLVYRFQKAGQNFYLRLTHAKLRPRYELEAALAFQNNLSNHGVPICQLTQSNAGNWIETIQQNEHSLLAHVCAEVPGQPITFDFKDNQIYETWGHALGQLHHASTQFTAENFKYSHWEDDVNELYGYVKTESQVIQTELHQVVTYLQNHLQTKANYGLIHGDHRKGNVLTDGVSVNIIDFDLPRFCWYMDDISRPFFSTIMQGNNNWQPKLAPYLKGYRAVSPLPDNELKTFPWFIQYKALNIYLWTKNNWKSDTAPGGANTQEWLSSMLKMITDQSWVKNLSATISSALTG